MILWLAKIKKRKEKREKRTEKREERRENKEKREKIGEGEEGDELKTHAFFPFFFVHCSLFFCLMMEKQFLLRQKTP